MVRTYHEAMRTCGRCENGYAHTSKLTCNGMERQLFIGCCCVLMGIDWEELPFSAELRVLYQTTAAATSLVIDALRRYTRALSP